VADALASGCSPDKIRNIANGILRELTATTFVSKERPAPRRKRDSKRSSGDSQHEKIVALLQAAGKEGMTGAALYNKGGFYGATLEAAASAGAIRKEGDRYFAPPSDPAM
jgi:hypothetical protein